MLNILDELYYLFVLNTLLLALHQHQLIIYLDINKNINNIYFSYHFISLWIMLQCFSLYQKQKSPVLSPERYVRLLLHSWHQSSADGICWPWRNHKLLSHQYHISSLSHFCQLQSLQSNQEDHGLSVLCTRSLGFQKNSSLLNHILAQLLKPLLFILILILLFILLLYILLLFILLL